jgi:hypothetical protein
LKGLYRDLTILSIVVFLLAASGFTLNSYMTTFGYKYLVIGLVMAGLGVLGAIARYRFVWDYLWTLWKKWR